MIEASISQYEAQVEVPRAEYYAIEETMPPASLVKVVHVPIYKVTTL